MSSRRCRYGLVTLLMVGLLLAIIPIQGAIHGERPTMFNPERKTVRRSAISIGPTPAVVAALGGFRTVAADLLWLKAERVWNGGDWWMMLPILDVVTQLDPQFLLAWKVYGWHAAYNLHGESQTLSEKNWWLDHGVDALERSVEANPDSWEMYFELGWTLYDRAHEPWRAAERFWQADQFEDVPHRVTRMYYRCFEHVMDFEKLFPAVEYALNKHKDIALHQRIVNRDWDWWTAHRDDPQEHRRQMVLENTARKQRSRPYYLFPDDPYWDVCPRCGLPSPKGSAVCENPLCKFPLGEVAGGASQGPAL